MALTTGGTLGTFSDKTARTRSTFRLNAISAGTYAVLIVAQDSGTADSVTDSSVNTWRRAGSLNAANGASVAVFFTRSHGTAMTTSGTYGVQHSASQTAKAVVGWRFNGTSGSLLSVTGSSNLTNTGADPGILDFLTPASREYLAVRGIAHEGILVAYTKTVAYDTAFGRANTAGGGAATNQGAYGEWDIRTDIRLDRSDPTMSAVDHASTLVALREIEPPAAPTATAKMEPNFFVRRWG